MHTFKLILRSSIVHVIGHIKGEKRCIIISLAAIFLHHENLAFEQECVDVLYPLNEKKAKNSKPTPSL